MEPTSVSPEPRHREADPERHRRHHGGHAPPECAEVPDRRAALVDDTRAQESLAHRLAPGAVTQDEVRHGHHELPRARERLGDEVEAGSEPGEPERDLHSNRPEERHDNQVHDERDPATLDPGRRETRGVRHAGREQVWTPDRRAPRVARLDRRGRVRARSRRRRGPLARVVHRCRHYSRPPGIIPGAAMIPVAEARARILADVAGAAPEETLPVARGLGRVLAKDVLAPFDVPSADNSAVDGYATRAADLVPGGRARLRVVADLPAGAVYEGGIGPRETLRIMTGAPMPRGTDTVVPQELSESAEGWVELGAVEPGANVRPRGEDVRAGTVVLQAGSVLRPQDLGLVASLGFAEVHVHRRPRVALLSTGDEVVEPGQSRRPGQIYDANRFSLGGMVAGAGADPLDLGIVPDVRELLRERLLQAAGAADVVLTSGGVSVGDYDLVKSVLGEIGSIDFWQVAMQPGRPVAVGRIRGAQFFGLPGNPVASVLCFHLFVRPALWKLGGRTRLDPECVTATAVEPMRKKAGRREFKRGILRFTDAGYEVSTTGPQGSGILSSMVAANCLIILEEARGDVKAGERVLVEPL